MAKMNISQNGIDLIKSFEGFRGTAYKALPTEQYYTIGFGHYGADVEKGETITEAQAEELLKKDLQKYVDGVNDGLKCSVNQNQFDALCSLCYNIGISAFQSSTLLEKLNAGDVAGASAEFDLWIHSGGKVIDGLVNRRNKEQALFNTPVKSSKASAKKASTKSTKKKTVYVPDTYKVKSGDTLSKIASEFGLTVSIIQSLNKIKDPDVIKVGQVLKLKEASTSSSSIKSVGTIKICNLKNFTYIYEKPSDKSRQLGTAKLNSTLHISGSVPNWYEVIYQGKRAYVKDKYAKRV